MGAIIKFLALLALGIILVFPLGFFFLTPFMGFYASYIMLALAVALPLGLVWGIVIPWRTLRASHEYSPDIATPAAVRRGEVARRQPSGPAAEFGWDLAWPTYIPYQVSRDQKAVIRATRALVSRIRYKWTYWWPKAPNIAWLFRWILALIHVMTVGVLLYSILGSIWVGVSVWLVITWITRLTFSLGQRLISPGIEFWERQSMKRGRSRVRCASCYRETHMPSFACPVSSCGVIHRDISPGLFGIRGRVCSCGSKIPHTVRRASRELKAICPFCDEELPRGAGSRRVVMLPVFGTVGAGKTQFLSSIITGLSRESDTSDRGIALTSLTGPANDFLRESLTNQRQGHAPIKTQHKDRPEGLPFLVEHASGSFELQLMDAAGESFVETERSRLLGYLDIANTLVFVVDPFSIDEVREELQNRNLGPELQLAQGNVQDAYGSVVDRLRADNADLTKKNLAIVVSKADVLEDLYPETPIPDDSDQVRQWLYDLGGDHLIRRVEMDFRKVQYFAVDSVRQTSQGAPMNTLAILDWTVTNHGGQAIFPAGAADSQTKIKQTEAQRG